MSGALDRCANADEQRHAWPDMASEAARQYWLRHDQYPGMIAAGQISEDDAAADIAVWQQIAQDWDWIATGKGTPASPDSLPARRAALDEALDRIIEQIGFRDTKQARARGAILAAMRWWAEVEGEGEPLKHARFLASVGHQWRAENGHPPLGDMIKARAGPDQPQNPTQAPATRRPAPAPEQTTQPAPRQQRQLFA